MAFFILFMLVAVFGLKAILGFDEKPAEPSQAVKDWRNGSK